MKELEKDRITVGLATCGIAAGAQKTFDKLKKLKLDLPLVPVGCAGMCYAEPIVTVRQKGKLSIYGYVTEDKVDLLLDCIKQNKVCEELFLGHSLKDIDYYKKQKRFVMENCGQINPLNLEHYKETKGYSGLSNALSKTSEEVIEDIKKSGLRGRGGAGFPTGLKWSFIAPKKGHKLLVCNGDEGDPGAFMNRTIMESDPFKVIEGMTIAAYAIGAKEGIIYTRAEYPLAIKTLQKAIDIARKNNLLGKNILNKNFEFDIRIQKGAGAFVCGEETALISSVEGKRGQPNSRPPYPAEKGIHNYPTNINNVGTLSHVATIMKIGVNEFTKLGTDKTKGTKVICLTGRVKKSGVIEVPMGIKLKEIIFDIGGGTDKGEFKAIQAGGPSGGCITKKDLNLKLDYETLQGVGAIMGSGGLVVMNDESCMVDVAKYFMAFEKDESCGKCTPCREGTTRMFEILEKITKGLANKKDLETLKVLAHYIKENSLCGLGQSAPNPVLSTMKNFYDEYLCHINKKQCPSHACIQLLHYEINDKCIGCGNCVRHCPVNCISGKPREIHTIDQSKCIKCGACYDVCAFDSINRK